MTSIRDTTPFDSIRITPPAKEDSVAVGAVHEEAARSESSIEEANEQIDILRANIEKHTSDAAQLAKKLAAHEENISVWTAASKAREIKKADYGMATRRSRSRFSKPPGCE